MIAVAYLNNVDQSLKKKLEHYDDFFNFSLKIQAMVIMITMLQHLSDKSSNFIIMKKPKRHRGYIFIFLGRLKISVISIAIHI